MNQFNHNILEADIERLTKEIKEKEVLLANKELSRKELIKEAIRPIIRKDYIEPEKAPEKAQLAAALGSQAQAQDGGILPSYVENMPPEVKIKVEELIDVVFHQGIEKAAEMAKQENAFVLDALHDTLADKLYEELEKRKII